MQESDALATVQVKINHIKQQQKHAQQQIAVIEAQMLPLKQQLSKWQTQEWQTQDQLRELQFQESELKFQLSYKPKDLPKMKTDDLKYLPLEVIDQLVKLKYDVDKLTFYRRGDGCSYEMTLTPQEYKRAVITRLTTESCRYCHSLFHLIDVCTKRKEQVCEVCEEVGHNKYHCTKQVRNLYSRKDHKKKYQKH